MFYLVVKVKKKSFYRPNFGFVTRKVDFYFGFVTKKVIFVFLLH